MIVAACAERSSEPRQMQHFEATTNSTWITLPDNEQQQQPFCNSAETALNEVVAEFLRCLRKYELVSKNMKSLDILY
jgi:hypothetical protein